MSMRVLLALWVCLPFSSQAERWAVDRAEPMPAAKGLSFSRLEISSGGRAARLQVVTFSGETHSLVLMDDPAKAYDLASAAKKRGAVAAVNGGYFSPDRTPLGLRVRQGQELHPIEHSRLLSGILSVSGTRMALLRVGEFKRPSTLREAVQAGPFLVDGGKAVAGLNASRSDPRTAVIAGSGNRWALLNSSAMTLAELGDALSIPGLIPGLKVVRALNLDGGSSTGLWVAGEPEYYSREFRDVRDFVGIVAR